jgi:hypothetical protein
MEGLPAFSVLGVFAIEELEAELESRKAELLGQYEAEAPEAWKEFIKQQERKDRISKSSVSPGVIGTIIVLTSVVLSFTLAKTVWEVFFLTILLDALALSGLYWKLRMDITRERMSRYAQFVREHPNHAPFIDPLKD